MERLTDQDADNGIVDQDLDSGARAIALSDFKWTSTEGKLSGVISVPYWEAMMRVEPYNKHWYAELVTNLESKHFISFACIIPGVIPIELAKQMATHILGRLFGAAYLRAIERRNKDEDADKDLKGLINEMEDYVGHITQKYGILHVRPFGKMEN